MDQNVVGSIVGAAVQVVLQNLISLCAEEIKLVKNFKKDLEKLKKSLLMVLAFLNDAGKQRETREAVKIWLGGLEAWAFDADNVLDELNYEVLRKKAEKEDKPKKKDKLKKVLRFSFPTRTMAVKIREINQRLEVINKEAKSFGLQSQLSAHAHCFVSDRSTERETESYSVDPIVVGRDNYVSRIVEKLTSNNSTHDEQEGFAVLPIVGMGGLGKTTTAKLVFQDEKIKRHFPKLIWVYVSEKFDAKDLFKKILESLTKQKVDLETKDALLSKIQETLEAQKYLLVLDDVWTDETRNWGDFRGALSRISSAKGNGILVTTRSENVASIMGTIRVPELSKLSDEECWSIIKGKAFPRKSVIPLEFESIGRKIAERCQGLPLAANVLGGLLHGKSKEEWYSIEGKRLSDLGRDGDSVGKILKLSFDNLPSQSLKKCFAFCSIFPKGFEIERDMLIYLWMAEGFLHSDENDMEAMGQKYLHFFLQNSLLQQNWREDSCKMHDLVHDLASSVSRESDRVRYMYVESDRDISKEKAANLRSLIIDGKASENMFVDLKCLRGLVLIGRENKELPKLEHIIHLRYLDISKTGVEYLPWSIGNLYHLQTLMATSDLNEMPNTLKKLINLRHLHILDTIRESNIEEIPMLGHLPHLKSLYLASLSKVRFIGSLTDGIHNESIVKDKNILFPALKSLTLRPMDSMTELINVGESPRDREVVAFPHLESLELHDCKELSSGPICSPCLKELEISFLRMTVFLENLLLNSTSLTKLTINNVEGLVRLPDMLFSNNQNLSYLKIYGCQNLKHLPGGFGPSLRNIEIFFCGNLEELPNNLHCLISLETLEIFDCHNLKLIPYNPTSEGHEPVQGFTSLRKLEISKCASLSELPGGMIELCTSLEYLQLCDLPSVTNLAEVVGCLQKMPYLATLGIDLRYIPELDSNNFPLELGSFRSLCRLRISCGVENWERVQDQLKHLTNLRRLDLCHLEIEEVPEWLGNLSSLEELQLWDCPKLKSLPSKEAMKRLTKLLMFSCPLLNVRRGDEEWHKISHISCLFPLLVRSDAEE